MRAFFVAIVAFAASAAAFTPTRAPLRRTQTVRMGGREVLGKVQETQLLSKVSQLGVLSKAEAAGITLSDLEPLLLFADENGAMGLLNELLDSPAAPALVEATPSLLPLAGAALNVPPPVLLLAAPASLAAAYAEVQIIDDSSFGLVALQTFLAILLGAVVPAVSLVGAAVLGYKK